MKGGVCNWFVDCELLLKKESTVMMERETQDEYTCTCKTEEDVEQETLSISSTQKNKND